MTTEIDGSRPGVDASGLPIAPRLSESEIPKRSGPTEPAPAPRDGSRWPWWLLRLLFTGQALATFLQPVFAGRFLAGDFGALDAHRATADLVFGLSIGQLAVVALVWRLGRAPARLMLFAILLAAGIYLQLHAGFSRDLGLHIPLGVLIVGVTGWLLVWVWRAGPARTPAVPAGEEAGA